MASYGTSAGWLQLESCAYGETSVECHTEVNFSGKLSSSIVSCTRTYTVWWQCVQLCESVGYNASLKNCGETEDVIVKSPVPIAINSARAREKKKNGGNERKFLAGV